MKRVAGLLGVLMLVACGSAEERVFSETPSPDGTWTLRITVAASRMPQGRRTVSAYLVGVDQSVAQKVFATELDADGVPFTANNIAARWTAAHTTLVCLRATDRPDRGMRIEVEPQPRATAVDAC